MQNHRFVVLAGHLSNYPLSDLVGILRHQRKSGRLLIEYPKGPAMFFFQDGELIDARMNELTGLQAICVALAQPESSFNFNPLIQNPRRTIDPSLHRAVSELFGCWDESALQIEAAAAPSPEVLVPAPEVLALPPAPPMLVRRRSLLFVAAAVVIVIALSTVIAVTGGFTQNQPVVAASVQPSQAAPVAAPVETSAHHAVPAVSFPKTRRTTVAERKEEKQTRLELDQASQPIKVVMQIENGRVLKASVANHKPGMDSYEALALRIARQRRYGATVTGGETVTINVGR